MYLSLWGRTITGQNNYKSIADSLHVNNQAPFLTSNLAGNLRSTVCEEYFRVQITFVELNLASLVKCTRF